MVRLAIITDAHYARGKNFLGTRLSGQSIEKIKAVFDELPDVDRIVNLGDVVNATGDEAEDCANIREIMALLNGAKAPCVHVLGNHDCEAAKKRVFLEKSYYAFTIDNVRFVVLDGNFIKAGPSYDEADWNWIDAWIHEEQRAWLQRELDEAEGPVVVLCHQNLDDRGTDPHLIGNAAQIRAMLEKSGKVAAVLQGHCHAGCFNEQNGIPYYTFPALCEGMNAPYALVEIDGMNVSVTQKKAVWPKTIRLAGIVDDSVVDGPGMRLTVFTQGCFHHCPGCHNPQTHDPAGGEDKRIEDIIEQIEDNILLSGVTLSGGDPFEQPAACVRIAKGAHALGLNVWAYTGYLYENLLSGDPVKRALLEEVDVLVDGPFILAQKSYECRWRGSPNQRLIDVKASLKKGSPVLLEE